MSINKNRLGALVAIITKKEGRVYLTRLLKLIYIIDKRSFLQSGIELTDSEYLLWKNGPVNDRIYIDVNSDNSDYLKNYVNVTSDSSGTAFTSLDGYVDQGNFSKNELMLIEDVIIEYSAMPTNKIIEELHKEGSLWHETSVEKGCLDAFNESKITTTNHTLDFKKLIPADDKRLVLNSILHENLMFQKALLSD